MKQIYLFIAIGILAIATGISTYRFMEEKQNNKALEASVKILENDFDELLAENKRLIDSIETVKENRGKVISEREKEIADLIKEIDSLLNLPDETPIDHINDPDSISDLFSRFYPDKHRAGQRSN